MPGPRLIVVLGAGASTGCLPSSTSMIHATVWSSGRPERVEGPFEDLKPPVTSRLVARTGFHNRYVSRYPDSQNVVDALRGALLRSGSAPISLENALATYTSRETEHSHRQLLAFRFYLRDLLLDSTDLMRSNDLGGGPTLYTTLVDSCYDWARTNGGHVCFVSFNYDLLLEHACATTWRFNMQSLGSYCSNPLASVVKPYGSALWERHIKNAPTNSDPTLVANSVLDAVGYELDERVSCFGDQDSYHPSVPELALPVADKSELLWLPDQQRHFSELEGSVSRVLVIGWRAQEDHFLPFLRRAMTPQCQVVAADGSEGRGASEDGKIALGKIAGSGPSLAFPGDFNELLNAEQFRDLLEP